MPNIKHHLRKNEEVFAARSAFPAKWWKILNVLKNMLNLHFISIKNFLKTIKKRTAETLNDYVPLFPLFNARLN